MAPIIRMSLGGNRWNQSFYTIEVCGLTEGIMGLWIPVGKRKKRKAKFFTCMVDFKELPIFPGLIAPAMSASEQCIWITVSSRARILFLDEQTVFVKL